MSAVLPRRTVDLALPALLAATVFAFAAGSSSLAAAKSAAHDLRWVALAALGALAAVAWRGRGRPDRRPAGAAAGFAALAIVSAAWSVAPRDSLGRGVSLALLLGTVSALGAYATVEEGAAGRLLAGLVAGAGAVALAGLALLAVSYHTAVESASIEAPARLRGFGEDPNTASLLFALALPIAIAALAAARSRRLRAAAGCAALLFAGSIVGSGSRGALLAAAAGSAVAVAIVASCAHPRRLAALLAAVVLATVGAAYLQSLPDPVALQAPVAATAAPPHAAPRYQDVEQRYPLDNDVGRPLPGGGEPPVSRSFFGTSGRTTAWRGALDVAADRPLLGYGFGTEARAFVDRYYGFVGSLPENSYVGITLQLGIVGLLALLGLVALVAASGARAVAGPGRVAAAACAGVVAAGLAVGVVQSYLYSVGNLATLPFWASLFLLPALPRTGRAS